MVRRAFLLCNVALTTALLSVLAIAAGSALTSSCHSPSLDFGGGEAGMGGGIACSPRCGTGEECLDDSACESNHCEEGKCQAPACDDRILNGNESDTDCGGACEDCPVGSMCLVTDDCEAPPDGDPAAVECRDGTCQLNCPDDTGDCNARADDGCEVDLLTSLHHCGACKEACAPEHAQGSCVAGQCLIKTDEANGGCDTNYANCNSLPEDGCEVNLLTDPEHCGACDDSACSDVGGVPSCSGGECSIECDAGRGNCDLNARDNGCETNTTNNVRNCNGCDTVCEVSTPGYSPYCRVGTCGQTLCDPNEGDCNGDGICSDSLLSVEHCGGCYLTCAVAHGTPDCVLLGEAAECAVGTCDTSQGETWADCDGSYVTGCEVNTESNRFRCGGCLPEEGGSGEDCTLKEGQQNVTATACTDGGCEVVGCSSGWGDCDGYFSNGCETNLNNDPDFCGGCNIACTDKVGDDSVAAVSCQAGACQVEDCSGNRLDCDGTFSNGCEVDPDTNKTHCGGCNDGSGISCNAKLGDDDVTGVACDAGSCMVTTCEPSRGDCDGTFGNGCEVNTSSSPTHCGACVTAGGDACDVRAHASGLCQGGSCSYTCDASWDDPNGDLNSSSDSDGCEARKLTVVNHASFGSQDTGGEGGPPLTISHTLEGASGTRRLLLVGVVCRGESAGDCTLTTANYGSTQLTLLGSTFAVNSSAQIFYALDANLPAAGTHTLTLDRNDNWGSIAANVVELSGANQQTFYSDHAGDTNSNPCNVGADTEISLSGLAPGSLVYAVGGGDSDETGMATPDSSLSSATSEYGSYIVFGSAYSGRSSGSVSAAFDFTGCNQSAMYAVGVRPALN